MSMERKEITELLSELLKRDVLSSMTWASEVKYTKFDNSEGRVDFMSFKPSYNTYYKLSERNVQCGTFTAYEIKSSMLDYKSGLGLNFIGDKNFIVMPMELYKNVRTDGKISNVGVLVPVPMYSGKQTNEYFYNEFNNPTPLTTNKDEWRLYKIRDVKANDERRYGTAELLYAMLKARK